MKNCNSCGKCCLRYGADSLNLTDEELDDWQANHPDLFAYVKNKQVWFDPQTHQQPARCPFLMPANEQTVDSSNEAPYQCSIYERRPIDCRIYPSTVAEMIEDDCEMLEAKDKQAPKQAQRDLSIIMSDSWSL